MADRTLVVSATRLLWRGFFVVPTDRKSRDGMPVNGLFAVARAIPRVMASKMPARAVAVVDANAGKEAWPEALRAQLAPLPELLAAFGLRVVEAPDELHLVASYARAALDRGDDAIVVGVDKRYAQLVNDRLWWYDANKDTRYTAEIVQKRFGVPPSQVAEWLALVGEEDALPGIAGVGAKGATTLLETYGSVAGALEVLATIKGRLGNALRAAGEALPRELARARLDTSRPLPVPLDALAYEPPAVAPLNRLLERLGFTELLLSDGASTRTEVCETPAEVAAALARLGSGPIALHAVLEDPSPLRETLAGMALSAGQGDAFYVACAGPAWAALVPWLEDARAPKLGHDLLPAAVCLRRAGIEMAGVVGDSAHASHLTQPSNWAPHDVAGVARQVLGRALPDEDSVRGVGQKRKAWAALPAERAAELAGVRAQAAEEIWRALSPDVDAALLAEYLELADTCARMELTGLVVDGAALDHAEQAFAGIEAELTQRIEALAGRSFNINSTKQLGAVLFAELKLPVASHTKTGWSTSTEALQKIEHAHPIVPLVIRWRLLRRLRDSWVIGLRRCIDVDGRVHSRFHVARSFSGHLVNTNPDLARVPGRTPEMEMIRRAFVAPPGCVLMSVDFNQLGLYVLAHLTRDPALVEPLLPARGHAPAHRVGGAGQADRVDQHRRSPARQDRQLRDLRGAGLERPGPRARRVGAGGEGHDRPLRSPVREGARVPGRAAAPRPRAGPHRHHRRAPMAHRWARVARPARPLVCRASRPPRDARGLGRRRRPPRSARSRSRSAWRRPRRRPGPRDCRRGAVPGARRRSWRRPPGPRYRPCSTPTSSRCPWSWASKRVPTGRTSSR